MDNIHLFPCDHDLVMKSVGGPWVGYLRQDPLRITWQYADE